MLKTNSNKIMKETSFIIGNRHQNKVKIRNLQSEMKLKIPLIFLIQQI